MRSQDAGRPGMVPTSVATERIIRRSLRCFHFAVLGLVPILGIGVALLALRLYRQVLHETGERCWPNERDWTWYVALIGYWGVAAFFALAYGLLFGFWAGAFVSTIFVALGGWLLFRLCQQARSRHWNPARHYLYWGVGLANLGCLEFLLLIGGLVRIICRL